jgi:hypothetical protein
METDPVSETSCSILFRIQDDGESPEPSNSECRFVFKLNESTSVRGIPLMSVFLDLNLKFCPLELCYDHLFHHVQLMLADICTQKIIFNIANITTTI